MNTDITNDSEDLMHYRGKLIVRNISPIFFNNLTSGARVCLIQKKDDPKIGDNLWFREVENGKHTGRGFKALIIEVSDSKRDLEKSGCEKVYLTRVSRKDGDHWAEGERLTLKNIIWTRH